MKVELEIDKVVKAIKDSEPALASDITSDVNPEYITETEFYGEFSYQIDDRVDRMDSEVKEGIETTLGEHYYASVDREDAFPDGHASYNVTIEKMIE